MPGLREIPGNGIDDDCDPTTSDDVCPDDLFDTVAMNGTAATASAVNAADSFAIGYRGLTICPADEDWYKIDLAAGDGVEVDLFFAHDDGDVDVVLYRQEGDDLVFIDAGVTFTDNETVYLRRVDIAGTYLIRVFQSIFARDAVSYGMSVNRFAQCIDDADEVGAEQNDGFDAAVEFCSLICSYDYDVCTFDSSVKNAASTCCSRTAAPRHRASTRSFADSNSAVITRPSVVRGGTTFEYSDRCSERLSHFRGSVVRCDTYKWTLKMV